MSVVDQHILRRRLVWSVLAVVLAGFMGSEGVVNVVDVAPRDGQAAAPAPPRASGYFHTRPAGSWRKLPDGTRCADRIHHSGWEPRPDNDRPNHTMPRIRRVHAAFRHRPVAIAGAYNKRWDSWLRQRVTGHHTGTTDENIQWAACKWGISDNVLRAIAVRESTWYQYEVYRNDRCVTNWGCGDMIGSATRATKRYCTAISRYHHNYQRDFGQGRCPKTFSIAGVMSWEDPSWGRMPGNQNGTFPFNRNSTAFALDYLASFLRGCDEGWARWLDTTGTRRYTAGQIWGCVGAWYAGAWRTPDARGYVHLVRSTLRDRTWLRHRWPTIRPACSPTFGCPRGI